MIDCFTFKNPVESFMLYLDSNPPPIDHRARTLPWLIWLKKTSVYFVSMVRFSTWNEFSEGENEFLIAKWEKLDPSSSSLSGNPFSIKAKMEI